MENLTVTTMVMSLDAARTDQGLVMHEHIQNCNNFT